MAEPITTITLDEPNVFQTDLKVDQARDLVDTLGDLGGYDDLVSELDEAQGHVYGSADADTIAYLVITIVK